MGEELRGKVFRSGNSMALRLPKALGFRDGDDVVLVDQGGGSFTFRLAEHKAAELDAVYGSFSADFMAAGREQQGDEARAGWEDVTDASSQED